MVVDLIIAAGAEFTVSPPAVATADRDADCDKMAESTETDVGTAALRSDLLRSAPVGEEEWNGGS